MLSIRTKKGRIFGDRVIGPRQELPIKVNSALLCLRVNGHADHVIAVGANPDRRRHDVLDQAYDAGLGGEGPTESRRHQQAD